MIPKLLKIFAYGWSGVVVIIILLSIIGILLDSDNLWEGMKEVANVFSPFNVANFIVTVLILSPAIGAFKLSEYLQNKADEQQK